MNGGGGLFPLLADLNDSELEIFSTYLLPVALERGQYLFREGDPGDSFYLIASGILVAEREIDREAGTRKSLAILPPLSSVGEMAINNGEVRSASVRAEIPAQVLRMSRDSLDDLERDSPSIALKLYRAFFRESSRRLRTTNEELVAVYETGRLMADSSDARKTAETMLLSLRARLGAGTAIVSLYESKSNQLCIVHALGTGAELLLDLRIPLDVGLPARAFDERKPFLLERLLGATEPWEAESMLLLPLIERNNARGVLLFGVPDGGRPFTVAQLSLATAVANIVAPLFREAFALP